MSSGLSLQGVEYGQVDLVGYGGVYVLHAVVLVEVGDSLLSRALGSVTLCLDSATRNDVFAYVLEHGSDDLLMDFVINHTI